MMNSGRTALTTTARRSSDRPATPAHLAAHLSTPALLFSFNAFPKTRPLTAPETRGSPWIVLLDCPLSGPYTDHYTDGSTLPTYYHTYSLLTTHHSPLTTHYSLLTAYRLLLATYRPANLTTYYSLLTTHYSLLTILITTNGLLRTAHYSLLTTHYALRTTHYTYYLLLTC